MLKLFPNSSQELGEEEWFFWLEIVLEIVAKALA